MALLISKWLTRLFSHVSALEESRLERFSAHAARDAALEVNKNIEVVSQAWFSQARRTCCRVESRPPPLPALPAPAERSDKLGRAGAQEPCMPVRTCLSGTAHAGWRAADLSRPCAQADLLACAVQVLKAVGGVEAMLQRPARDALAAEMERGRGVHAIPHPAILKAAYKTRAHPCLVLRAWSMDRHDGAAQDLWPLCRRERGCS